MFTQPISDFGALFYDLKFFKSIINFFLTPLFGFIYLFFNLFFNFIFKLYNIVLVLPCELTRSTMELTW